MSRSVDPRIVCVPKQKKLLIKSSSLNIRNLWLSEVLNFHEYETFKK